MTNIKYLRFKHYDIIGNFIACAIWFSLSSYIVIVKGKLGIDLINILEAIITIVSLAGIKYGFELLGKVTFSKMVLLDIVIETIFLIIFICLVYIDSNDVGLSIYLIMMMHRIFNPIKKEKERYVEDHQLSNIKYKHVLSNIRKKSNYAEISGDIVGIVLVLICINVLAIDIRTFVLSMITLSVMQNIFDYYKWCKYLR